MLYKNQSFDLVNYLIDNYSFIPDKIFYLNSSICLELLLKNLIIYEVYNIFLEKENNEQIYQEFLVNVKQKMKDKGHEIDELLNIDKALIKKLSIKSVNKINGNFVNQFQINFNDNTSFLIPTLEALRYGVFSNQQHVSEFYDKEELLKLLKEVMKYVNKKVVY